MKRDKQIKAYAKNLFKLCLDNGTLSEERVAGVLTVLSKNPPRNYGLILRELLKLAEKETANSTAEIEYAGAISDAAVAQIRDKFTQVYNRPISVVTRQNDELIAGIRVRVGCDVYESSVAGSLNELRASLS